ncbi:hypothetical protein VZT92_012153 [Zoarces viviparus]|uniref:LITAF domain-containing protein n=1 Tax=Zoarces viviparus TaxID=48416 RepID=A0AAW1F855_ZOAVI
MILMTCEDSDQLCELETIQKELDELLIKKQELEKQGNRSELGTNKGEQGTNPTFYKTEAPRGGIYMLPRPESAQKDFTLQHSVKVSPVADTPAGSVIPVDYLDQTPALTKCPSCEEVVFTETRSRVGHASWTICFFCTLIGCVGGCCLIPFCMSNLRDVHHQCPECRATIHNHQPF